MKPTVKHTLSQKTRRAVINYSILGIIIVALSLYLAFRRSDRMQYELPILSSIEEEDIDQIEMRTQARDIDLTKSEGEWRLGPEGFLAESSKVSQILRTISSLTLTDLVSVSGNHERYELDEQSRIRVKAYVNNKIVRQFDIGKRAPSYSHTYVMIKGDERIFQAKDDFRTSFDKTKDDFRDLLVLSFDKVKITEVSVRKDDLTLRLTKTVSQTSGEEEVLWQTETGENWDSETIDKLLDQLSNLKCTKYYKGDESSLADPVIALNIIGEDSNTIEIYPEQDAGHPARSSDNEYTFLLSSWNRDTIVQAFDNDEQE